MFNQLSLDAFLNLAKTASRVAVHHEIVADRLTPIGIVESLTSEMSDGVILESGMQQQHGGRYSFIAFGAEAQLRVENNIVSQKIGEKQATVDLPPFVALRQLLQQLSCAAQESRKDFVGGAVGFVAYDAVRLFESIPDRHKNNASFPDMLFKFYRTTLVFDHVQQKLLISVIVNVNAKPQENYEEAQAYIQAIIAKLSSSATKRTKLTANTQTPAPKDQSEAVTDLDDPQFMQLVARAKDYIQQGDAFQVVLSRCFSQPYAVPELDIYRALRSVSPSPYMFYLPMDDCVIVGASPEKLISVYDRKVTINPIAGTRRRLRKNQDDQIAAELLEDKKERAEHIMLVDLARNDIGAVCKPGSVKVEEFMQVKHFSHVSHITSLVAGELRDELDALDALSAAFPAGTLSGAPKIRAMEIIDELEISRRGIYGGAICRLDYAGNLDSCIAIRMAVLKNGMATVRAGAGIVHDSNPQDEANETRNKAQGLLVSIANASFV